MIVCLCGKPGSGKDTAAIALLESGFVQAELKGAIEQVVYHGIGVPWDVIKDRDKREKPLSEVMDNPVLPDWTTRKLLQHIGQTWREQFGEDIWPQRLWGAIKNRASLDDYVISDARTPRDVGFFIERAKEINRSCILIMVRRKGFGATTEGGFKNHILESYDLEPLADAIIDNDGTIGDLQMSVMSVVEEYLQREKRMLCRS